MINDDLKIQLRQLAFKYETADFLTSDPSRFMHQFSIVTDVEIMAFTASALAFGLRLTMLRKLDYIYSLMHGNPTDWLLKRKYEKKFPDSNIKFYRFISFGQMRRFFDVLRLLIVDNGTIGHFLEEQYKYGIEPLDAMIECYKSVDVGGLVPKNSTSACKRLNMFFRWMVRSDSPVDMGLWTWYDKRNLIIPADVHVMAEAVRLGIVDKVSPTLSKAREITDALREVWPEDPCKGDFALFGVGVNKR